MSKTNTQRTRERRKKYPELYLWDSAKRRAEKLGIPFEIEVTDISIPKRCPVLGMKIRVCHPDQEKSASLDRIIPSLGYVPGNVVVISMKANRLKNNATFEELTALVKWLKRMM